MVAQFFPDQLNHKEHFLLGKRSIAHPSRSPGYKIHNIQLLVDLEDMGVQEDISMAHDRAYRQAQHNKYIHEVIDYQHNYLVDP